MERLELNQARNFVASMNFLQLLLTRLAHGRGGLPVGRSALPMGTYSSRRDICRFYSYINYKSSLMFLQI